WTKNAVLPYTNCMAYNRSVTFKRVPLKPSVPKDGRRKSGRGLCTLHASFLADQQRNPKGILPQSPGLRETSYPGGCRWCCGFNPERVVARAVASRSAAGAGGGATLRHFRGIR